MSMKPRYQPPTLVVDSEPVAAPRVDDTPWRPIAQAPRDGRPIMVRATGAPDGPGVPAIWHRTRRWVAGKWTAVAFWGNPATKWPVEPEPDLWRQAVHGEQFKR